MHITLVDDSIPFDGYTASSRPLGGAEKGFAALAGALARRGHTVSVFNRCRWSMFIEGAQWETFEAKKPLLTDVLIALRKPELLGFVRQAKRRVLWHTAPGRMLEKKSTRATLQDMKPTILLCSEVQAEGWRANGLKVALLPAALKSDFQAKPDTAPERPPRAIVTTHPAHGLPWLIDLWVNKIRPQAPDAQLHIHSTSLAKMNEGGGVEPGLEDLAAKIVAAKGDGVEVFRPQGDALMAEAYRQAMVHLYPGHPDDSTAFTLMESQACGTPAVLRPLGAAPGRVANGASAYVAPDDEAFANLTAMLLNKTETRASLGAEACALYQGRTWDAAAEKLETLLA
ncbi:glycosyltransferase [Magnetospirillum sulfuroxidans]|uniref:Glycosyltransferase n=1 Tax=Magnetospirillum sulfuroxidans TaxID=611300 RepID=A0ABS5ICW8_9PROT|nr:glycosyltransferase [Magnetospirillum sulfuroxidans]MBR9972265.1 glycosyltransferase [Magnetospirillum sulfuroxidans]